MSRVLVAGGIDVDVEIHVEHHPLPGEEVGGHSLRYLPGGKGANVAVAASRAGADAVLFGCVGDDAFGLDVLSFLNRENIDTNNVSMLAGVKTGMAFIVVDAAGQNTIVYDATRRSPFAFENPEYITSADVLVSQFDISEEAILNFLTAGREKRARKTIFNASPYHTVSAELLEVIDVLVVNQFELAKMVRASELDPANRAEVEAAAGALERPRGQALVVTVGPHGVMILEKGRATWFEALPVQAVDTTGAGDAFAGALAARLSGGAPMDEAARYANVSAGISVTRRGASIAMPHQQDVYDERYQEGP